MKKKSTVISAAIVGVALSILSVSPALAVDHDISPINEITGASTNLLAPTYVELDSAGNRYVTDTNNAQITVYAPNASGNAAPIRTYAGANTHITNPYGLAFDSSGRMFVVDGMSNKILVFAANASGNAAPIHEISVGAQPYDVEFNPVTGELVVSEYGQIESFASPHTAVAASHVISTGTGHTLGLAVNATGGMYVSDSFVNRVLYFASFASSSADRTIAGSNTGFNTPWDLEIHQSSGSLLVANSAGTKAILEFAATANGDIAPINAIKGTNPVFNQPTGIALTSSNDLVVVERSFVVIKTFSMTGILPVSNGGGSNSSSSSSSSSASQAALANTGLDSTALFGAAALMASLGLAAFILRGRDRVSPRSR